MKFLNASKRYCRALIALLAFAAIAASSLLVSTSTSAAPPKTKVDTPQITCGGETGGSIDITVCAPAGTGATGLPAGFTVQWMLASEYALGADGIANTSDDNIWWAGSSYCDASFSGNASGSRYNLAAGQCVTVRIGDLLFDNGTSTSCPVALRCGTAYVFRAFGHAKTPLNRSEFTPVISCSTLRCGDVGGCTLTQGYWKTHSDLSSQCSTDPLIPSGPLCVAWPTTTLTLGNVSYNQAQLLSILNKPAQGNGLLTLAHQLIAAKLNVANGVPDGCAAASIAAADALIGNLIIPPVGTDSLAASATSALVLALDDFNNGRNIDQGCPGHCESDTTTP